MVRNVQLHENQLITRQYGREELNASSKAFAGWAYTTTGHNGPNKKREVLCSTLSTAEVDNSKKFPACYAVTTAQDGASAPGENMSWQRLDVGLFARVGSEKETNFFWFGFFGTGIDTNSYTKPSKPTTPLQY